MTNPLLAHHRHDAVSDHAAAKQSLKTLGWAVSITAAFAAVEFFGALWSGSVALMADAFHMVTDSSALFLALAAQWLASRPPTLRQSYGNGRIEALAAFINALAMAALASWLSFKAIDRFWHPRAVTGDIVVLIGSLGLLVNILVAWLLSRDQKSLNTKAALLHVLGDLLGSVAAILAGVVILFTGWTPIDSILSLLVCLLIFRATFILIKSAYGVLMDSVPQGIDLQLVGQALEGYDTVSAVHNLHIWQSRPGYVVLTAHLEVTDLTQWSGLVGELQAMLRDRFDIDHATLQPELIS
ncbi:MAG: cation transporter [Betaproteobacteria bacterium]|nr:cation transporter [Betaproteobacteria bacterium]